MIIIDPHYRKTVEIEGATFVLRPLTQRDAAETMVDKAPADAVLAAILASVVSATGFVNQVGDALEWSPTVAAYLKQTQAMALFHEIDAISGLSESDAKK